MADLVGQTLAHYRILRELGSGGMGQVYLAEDTQLRRHVALKVLPPVLRHDVQYLERFEREATAIASLNHPNIVTIFSIEKDLEPPFLTMELIEGKTLTEKIPAEGMTLEGFFDVAIPLTDALSAAHARGIIHRDLKPGNVMISDEGRVKILDFGLAKRTSAERDPASGDEPTQMLTEAGAMIGTAPYMSPEQVRGDRLDERSDLFSLGIILHEMATGQRPFKGRGPADLVSSILRDQPPEISAVKADLPRHLGRIVHRCLEKDVDRRFQTALDVRNDLVRLREELLSGDRTAVSGSRRPAGRGPSRIVAGVVGVALALGLLAAWWFSRGGFRSGADGPQRIVVLPFENLGSAEDAYFATGVTEEITSRLATVRSLRVISRRSAEHYAGSDRPITEIGEELGVDYVLAGSVRWAGSPDGTSRVRITPELIEVANGEQLWSTTFDREMKDIFGVQTEIAQTVVGELGVELRQAEAEALGQKPTENVDAYQAYLRGLDNALRPTWDERLVAQQMFERAVELDPGFVASWGELAKLHAFLYFAFDRTPERRADYDEVLARLKELAPGSPITRLATGYYHYSVEKDHRRALQEFQALVAERPHDPEALQALARPQRILGRVDEAIETLQRAVELDPKDASLSFTLVQTLQGDRRWKEAEAVVDRLIADQPDMVQAYTEKYNIAVAAGELDRARKILEDGPATGRVAFLRARAQGVDWLERKWENLLGALEQAAGPGYSDLEKVAYGVRRAPALDALGRTEEADAVRREMESILRSLLEENPEQAYLHSNLANVLSGMGRSEEAFEAMARARELANPDDVWNGTLMKEHRAEILARTAGREEEAVRLLGELLETSYANAISRVQLRLAITWDPLREEPGFGALLEEGASATP